MNSKRIALDTALYSALLASFLRLRKARSSASRDEFSWSAVGFLRNRHAVLRTKWDQLLRVRLDSLGDLQAAFGREGEEGIPGVLAALPEGGVVLDIGAHIGGFALIAARAVGARGKVYAIEPIAANVALLRENGPLNQIDWIEPIQAAVGRKSGTINLLVSDADTMWATMRPTWSSVLHQGAAPGHTRSQEVPLITVDNFLAENRIEKVDLIKIDVEAAELDVLIGAQRSLAAGCIAQLVIEVHSPTVKWGHIAGFLRRYGYAIDDIGGGEMRAHRDGRLPALSTAKPVHKPLAVAVIGCGAVSELQYTVSLDALANQGLVETVAIVDPDSQRRLKLASHFTTAQQFADFDGMIREVQPDLAIVAAPHRFHADLTVHCLAQGMHVLCEKPMAVNTYECDQMIRAAQAAQKLLAVGHFRRFYSSCETVKQVVDSHCLGAVRSFRFREGYHYNWPLISASVFDRKTAGGGVLMDTGAHALDLLLWWLGELAVVAYQDDALGGVEANCLARLRTTSGAEGTVQLSRDWPLANSCVIEFDKGWIEYSCDVTDQIRWGLSGMDYSMKSALLRLLSNAEPATRSAAAIPASNQPMDYFTNQLRNMVDAIYGNGRLRVTGSDGRKVIALTESCYSHRELLPMSWLNSEESQRALLLSNAQ